MRTYQKGFEQNSIVTIVTFILLYIMAYFASKGEMHYMYSITSICIFGSIMLARFIMLLFGKEERIQFNITRILIYCSSLFWSVSYGIELKSSAGFSDHHMLLIIFIMGIAAAGALGLSKDNKLTVGFLTFLIPPAALFSFLYLDKLQYFIGSAFAMYYFYLVVYTRKYYRISQENLFGKIELQKQKTELEESHYVMTKQNEKLHDSFIKATEADKAKSLFLANMSHEIRTPLNGIIGVAHLMKEETISKEQSKKLSIIQFSAETLVSLVNDILDFSKIEAEKMDLDIDHFDFYEMINNVNALFELTANEKGLSFKGNIGEKVPQYLLSDQTRIKQILINLINNAIKFTSSGGVELIIEADNDAKENLILKFSIIDTGIGISKKNQEKIFSSFTQSDASFTRKFGGTGLGLAISEKIVKMMGGQIGVESELGKGANFWFTIAADYGKNINAFEVPLDIPDIPELSILLAEDNKVNVIVAKQIISKAGHKVSVANNGLEAIELYKSQVFDLILMDIMMPEMDGLTATSHIRKLEKRNNSKPIPIIALTANVVKEDQVKYMNSGMNDFISKPIHPNILIQKIQKLFSSKKE